MTHPRITPFPRPLAPATQDTPFPTSLHPAVSAITTSFPPTPDQLPKLTSIDLEQPGTAQSVLIRARHCFEGVLYSGEIGGLEDYVKALEEGVTDKLLTAFAQQLLREIEEAKPWIEKQREFVYLDDRQCGFLEIVNESITGALYGMTPSAVTAVRESQACLSEMMVQLESKLQASNGAIKEVAKKDLQALVESTLDTWSDWLQELSDHGGDSSSLIALMYDNDPKGASRQILRTRAVFDQLEECFSQIEQQLQSLQQKIPELPIEGSLQSTLLGKASASLKDLAQARKSLKQIKEPIARIEVNGNFQADDDADALSMQKAKRDLRPVPALGRFVRQLWSAGDWSPFWKNLAFGLGTGMMLSAEGIRTYQAIQAGRPPARANQPPQLSSEDSALLEREVSALGAAFGDYRGKLDRAPKRLFEKLPGIRSFLEQVIDKYGNQVLSKEQQGALVEQFRTQRRAELLGSRVTETAGPAIRKSGLAQITPALIAEKGQEALKEAGVSLAAIDNQVGSLPRGTQLHELQAEVAKFRGALRLALNECPEDRPLALANWMEQVHQVCWDVRLLEEQIGKLMSAFQLQDDQIQLLDRYGTKHKNIVLQSWLRDALKMEGVEVPVPKGVTSDQVRALLEARGGKVFELWTQLGSLYYAQDRPQGFLDNPESKVLLEKIQTAIGQAFVGASDQLLDDGMLTWLKDLQAKSGYLMVRSTGAEDSRATANAGGNASLAYVSPAPEQVCRAVGEVVVSYFGFASLKNRLDAGLDPFSEELKLAVTAQELIGEEIGGSQNPADIPVSAVLFTNEPLYIGGEKFRVTRMSMAYGHGEGVVGMLGINSDTALILHSVKAPDKLYVLYDNQHKPERLAPVRNEDTGEVSLQKLPNPKELQDRPALNSKQIIQLYEWGVVGEKFFDNEPTDMELVLKRGTLYPVQARPVNRPDLLPTYIDHKLIEALDANPILGTEKAQMIVPGKGSAVEVVKPEEILIRTTLLEALEAYNSDLHKVVVVSTAEPANSHPVVNFSNLGVPCLLVEDLSRAHKLQKGVSPEQSLAVCMQEAEIHRWDRRYPLESVTSSGFVVHPAKIALSLPVQKQMASMKGVSKQVPKEVRDLVYRIRRARTQEAALAALCELETHEWTGGLSERAQKLEEKLNTTPLAERSIRPVIQGSRVLQERIGHAFAELRAVGKREPQRLHWLMHVKVLETLLFQEGSSPDAVAHFSILGYEKHFAAADILIDYQRQLKQPARYADLLLGGTDAPYPSAFLQWKAFLLELESVGDLDEEGENFKFVVRQMQEAGVLGVYLTLFFPFDRAGRTFDFARTLGACTLETLRRVTQRLPARSRPEVAALQQRHRAIQGLEKQVSAFADPSTFEAAYSALLAECKKWEPQNCLLDRKIWDQQPLLVRHMAIKSLREFVTVYDASLKAMKASPQYSQEEKGAYMNEMLGPFLNLMDSLALHSIGYENFNTNENDNARSSISYVRLLLSSSRTGDARQLLPSDGFSVAAGTLDSGAQFSRSRPGTMEDIFTWVHQNLEGIIARLGNEAINTETLVGAELPSMMGQVEQELGLIASSFEEAKLSNTIPLANPTRAGASVSSDSAIVHYNLPLRHHSAQFQVVYDPKTGRTYLRLHLLGEARDRWSYCATIARIIDGLGILKLEEAPLLGPMELELKWTLEDGTSTREALDLVKRMAHLSLGLFENSALFFQHILNNPELDGAFLTSIPNFDAPTLMFLIEAFSLQAPRESGSQILSEMIYRALELGERIYDRSLRALTSDMATMVYEREDDPSRRVVLLNRTINLANQKIPHALRDRIFADLSFVANSPNPELRLQGLSCLSSYSEQFDKTPETRALHSKLLLSLFSDGLHFDQRQEPMQAIRIDIDPKDISDFIQKAKGNLNALISVLSLFPARDRRLAVFDPVKYAELANELLSPFLASEENKQAFTDWARPVFGDWVLDLADETAAPQIARLLLEAHEPLKDRHLKMASSLAWTAAANTHPDSTSLDSREEALDLFAGFLTLELRLNLGDRYGDPNFLSQWKARLERRPALLPTFARALQKVHQDKPLQAKVLSLAQNLSDQMDSTALIPILEAALNEKNPDELKLSRLLTLYHQLTLDIGPEAANAALAHCRDQETAQTLDILARAYIPAGETPKVDGAEGGNYSWNLYERLRTDLGREQVQEITLKDSGLRRAIGENVALDALSHAPSSFDPWIEFLNDASIDTRSIEEALGANAHRFGDIAIQIAEGTKHGNPLLSARILQDVAHLYPEALLNLAPQVLAQAADSDVANNKTLPQLHLTYRAIAQCDDPALSLRFPSHQSVFQEHGMIHPEGRLHAVRFGFGQAGMIRLVNGQARLLLDWLRRGELESLENVEKWIAWTLDGGWVDVDLFLPVLHELYKRTGKSPLALNYSDPTDRARLVAKFEEFYESMSNDGIDAQFLVSAMAALWGAEESSEKVLQDGIRLASKAIANDPSLNLGDMRSSFLDLLELSPYRKGESPAPTFLIHMAAYSEVMRDWASDLVLRYSTSYNQVYFVDFTREIWSRGRDAIIDPLLHRFLTGGEDESNKARELLSELSQLEFHAQQLKPILQEKLTWSNYIFHPELYWRAKGLYRSLSRWT